MAEFANVGTQSYNAFETSLRRQVTDNRFIGTTYFTLAYTWSKNIDTASGFRQRNSQVPYANHSLFRAVSDSDVPHNVTFSGGWDLPFAQWTHWSNALTKGWSLYPIVTYRSGFPIDIFAPLDYDTSIPGPSGYGDSELVHVNLNGTSVKTFDPKKGTDPKTLGAIYFSKLNFNVNGLQQANCAVGDTDPTCVFVAAGQGTYGSLPRNFFRGPSRFNADIALAKTTPLFTEKAKLELRLEAFNVFNHAQFLNPSTNFSSLKFGEITTTYDPRIIQIAGRITF
jgi:hypothetical protein